MLRSALCFRLPVFLKGDFHDCENLELVSEYVGCRARRSRHFVVGARAGNWLRSHERCHFRTLFGSGKSSGRCRLRSCGRLYRYRWCLHHVVHVRIVDIRHAVSHRPFVYDNRPDCERCDECLHNLCNRHHTRHRHFRASSQLALCRQDRRLSGTIERHICRDIYRVCDIHHHARRSRHILGFVDAGAARKRRRSHWKHIGTSAVRYHRASRRKHR